MDELLHIDLWVYASGAVLTSEVPRNWLDITYNERLEFIEGNVSQGFEYWTNESLYKHIETIAESMNRLLDKLHIGLVQMAMDCELEGDMNGMYPEKFLNKAQRMWDKENGQ